MGKLNVSFYLNGVQAIPVNWQDTDLTATFDDNAQPILVTDQYTFVNEHATKVLEWFRQRPFEGMPFGILIGDRDDFVGNYQVSGCIDFNEMDVINESEVRIKFKIDIGVDLLDEQFRAVSYGYLARGDGGVISQSDYIDVPVTIRKKFDAIETALISISLFLMYRELHAMQKELTLQKFLNIATALSDPLQKPAEFFKALGMLILILAYMAIMVIAIIRMIKVLYENIVPRSAKYKAMYERKLLEKGCEHFNMVLDCNISEIDWTVFMPSKTDNRIRKNQKDEGIPNISDFGYNVSEMFELILRKYNARTKKIGNKLYIRTESDPFWFETSSYILPDILFDGQTVEETKYRFNTEDFKANRLISFQYDPSDEHTMPNARETPFDSKEKDFEKKQHEKGVAFEAITDLATFTEQKYKLNRGLDEVRIQQALGMRKSYLTASETSFKVLLSVVDLVIKLFGGKTFGEKINESRGNLLLSSPSFSIAKSLVIQNGFIPQNHRSLLSAARLNNQYHYIKSFDLVHNPEFPRQRKLFSGVKIPFNFQDFKKCIDSSYFTTSQGLKGKFTSLKWSFDKDFAVADFWIEHKYVEKGTLIEKHIET